MLSPSSLLICASFISSTLVSAAAQNQITIPFTRQYHPYGEATQEIWRSLGAKKIVSSNNVLAVSSSSATAIAVNSTSSVAVTTTASGTVNSTSSASPAVATSPVSILSTFNIVNCLVFPASIGGQKVNLLLDTGSNVMWVGGQGSTYDSKASKSHKFLPVNANSTQSINYGDGSQVNCTINADTLQFNNISIVNQEICEVPQQDASGSDQTINPLFAKDGIAGLIGVGSPNNQQEGIADVMQTLFKQYPNMTQQVSFFYSGDNTGEVTIGGIDSSNLLSSDTMHWFNVSSKPVTPQVSHWTLNNVNSISVKGQPLTSMNGALMVLDTGSSLTILPDGTGDFINSYIGAVDIYANSGNPAFYAFPNCDSSKTITINIGSTTLTLSAKQLMNNMAATKGGDPITICASIFQSNLGGVQLPFGLLGANFLKHFVTVFDYQQNAVGLQLASGVNGVVASSSSPQGITASGSALALALFFLGASIM